MKHALLPVVLLLSTACGLRDAPGEPLYEAHRGAAGIWAQNSRSALVGSIEEGFDGIEFDIALTSDLVPILSHDSFFHDPFCQNADGSDIVDGPRIDSVTLEDAQSNYLCGGKVDEEFPDAEVFAEPPMTFDELLTALEDNPDILVHIDVKYEPGLTPAPEVFAEEVMSRWVAADLPNPWYMSANTVEGMQAFEAWGDANSVDVPSILIWPTFPPGESSTVIGLKAEFATALGTEDMVRAIRDAGADGIAATHRIVDRRQVEEVVKNGYNVSLWTVNDPALMETYSTWPLYSIITDFPEQAP